MDKVLPRRLGAEPIVDAICEIRFEKSLLDIVGLLPGLLMEKLGTIDEVNRLFPGQLPPMIEIGELADQAHIRLKAGEMYVSIGPRVLAVAMPDPYPGWTTFRAAALSVFELAKSKALIGDVSRVSVRYTDLIHAGAFHQLNASLALGGTEKFEAVEIRTVRSIEGIRVVNSIASPASTVDGRSGLVVDTDTLMEMPPNFWSSAGEHLDQLHRISKEVFFDLITAETLASLHPEY
ncbi:TIGR04255 family protein [Stenotrophomonas sp. S41]|uniref:TIGR04255 family protein n=1 Tax=Stenotrophomonas sp. S41 TaxID=2767464 RepID=UPI001909AF36|nr:TIGR04255 family protein [Stenotrophomonas sp. S41]MBK0011092.1 TIGR04255 family protein [Stenotrophomonas sp. S41]